MPNTDHPRVEPSPACVDRMTISRSRVQRLIDKAEVWVDETTSLNQYSDTGYAEGVRDALAYLLDPDSAPQWLAHILEV